jgi:hypothetical protein
MLNLKAEKGNSKETQNAKIRYVNLQITKPKILKSKIL